MVGCGRFPQDNRSFLVDYRDGNLRLLYEFNIDPWNLSWRVPCGEGPEGRTSSFGLCFECCVRLGLKW